MNAKIALLVWLALARVVPGHAADRPVLEALQGEVQTLKGNATDWAAWNAATDGIFHENETSIRNGFVAGAGPADLRPVKAPLAYFVWRYENEPTNYRRLPAYLGVIAGSSDERRIEALLELWPRPHLETDQQWTWMLTRAATPEWALQQIREAIASKATVSTYSLVFQLLWRFGKGVPFELQEPAYSYGPYGSPDGTKEGLPAELRAPAYDLVRRSWTKGPSNGEGDNYNELLLRIDREKARRELIAFYGTPEDPKWNDRNYDLYVVWLLDKYKGPSPGVAVAARKWLAECTARDRELYGKTLERLILFSDPALGTEPTLDKIHKLLRGQAKPKDWDELDTLVRALLELNSPAAADDLADFAMQPAIPLTTRCEILDRLVRRRHPRLPEIFAWWLREDDTGKHWLRNDAGTKWGDYGRQLLAEGDRINRQKAN